jgi:transposase-like protein
VDEIAIRVNNPRYWLFSVADRHDHLLHVRLFLTKTQALTKMFPVELCEEHLVSDAIFLVDGAP